MQTYRFADFYKFIPVVLFTVISATGCQHNRDRKDVALETAETPPKDTSVPTTEEPFAQSEQPPTQVEQPPAQAEQPTPMEPSVEITMSPQQVSNREMTRAFESLAFAESLIKEQADADVENENNLLAKAKNLYKEAQTRFDQGDFEGAVEFARASTDAGRGIQHISRASAASDSDLDPPANDPMRNEMLSTLMDEVSNKLAMEEAAIDEDARAFQDEGKRLLDQADAALRRGDMMAARQFTAGADAFSRVVDRLDRVKTAH